MAVVIHLTLTFIQDCPNRHTALLRSLSAVYRTDFRQASTDRYGASFAEIFRNIATHQLPAMGFAERRRRHRHQDDVLRSCAHTVAFSLWTSTAKSPRAQYPDKPQRTLTTLSFPSLITTLPTTASGNHERATYFIVNHNPVTGALSGFRCRGMILVYATEAF